MNAVSNNLIQAENGAGSDSDENSDDSPGHYQPISAGADDDVDSDDDVDTQFRRLPNGHHNGLIVNGVENSFSSIMYLSDDDDDEETKRREEEEEREREEAARRENERLRNAPLGEENASRVLEAMRGVSFTGVAPVWADRVPEEQWISQIRRSREPRESS